MLQSGLASGFEAVRDLLTPTDRTLVAFATLAATPFLPVTARRLHGSPLGRLVGETVMLSVLLSPAPLFFLAESPQDPELGLWFARTACVPAAVLAALLPLAFHAADAVERRVAERLARIDD